MESLHNWIYELDLACTSGYEPGNFRVTFTAGVILGSLVFSFLADKYGRKKLLLICLVIHSISVGLLTFIPVLNLYYACLAFLGASTAGLYLVCYVLLSELVPDSARIVITSIALFFFAQSLSCTALHFRLIST